MISEGSCDTKDWSNDAENSALITGIYFFNIYIFKQKIVILNCNHISQYYCFYCMFYQINTALIQHKRRPKQTNPNFGRVVYI